MPCAGEDKNGESGWAKSCGRISRKLAATAAFTATMIFAAGGLLPSAAHGKSSGLLIAQIENSSKSEVTGTGAPEKAKPVGNEICPVSGEKINPKDKVSYEYKGKIYNFCCTDCLEQFKKDPEKYINKMKKEKGTGSPEG
ncbi:MAG: YHS domain-containing protein [Nitrospiraceae bacterium]|nr:YHS domain-containing protein [Nitrospiraceae bacterium]